MVLRQVVAQRLLMVQRADQQLVLVLAEERREVLRPRELVPLRLRPPMLEQGQRRVLAVVRRVALQRLQVLTQQEVVLEAVYRLLVRAVLEATRRLLGQVVR